MKYKGVIARSNSITIHTPLFLWTIWVLYLYNFTTTNGFSSGASTRIYLTGIILGFIAHKMVRGAKDTFYLILTLAIIFAVFYFLANGWVVHLAHKFMDFTVFGVFERIPLPSVDFMSI